MIGIFGLLLIAMVLVVKFCKKTLKVEIVKDVTNNKIIQVEMYMFNKCIAGAIE